MTAAARIVTLITIGALAVGLSGCTTISDPPPTGGARNQNAIYVTHGPCKNDKGVTLKVDASP